MSANLDSTYGAAFIGMVIAAVLHGVSCVQAFCYYTNNNDSWHTKHSVTAVMIFDTLHQALITHTMYTYTVTDWGNPLRLQLIVWSLLIEVICNAFTAIIVQAFLTLRIWRLSDRNIYITGTCAILATAGFVTSLVYVAKSFKFENLADRVQIKGESIAVNVLGAVTDLLIAGTLCTLLHFSRTGFRGSDAIINKLIMFSVNTGLLTSLCALASMISILVSPDTFIYITFFFCLGRLYTNSLLATLNARKIIATSTESRSADTMSLSLRDPPIKSSQANRPRTISVKIDTTKQNYHPGNDQKLRNENPDLEAVQVVLDDEEGLGKELPYS